MAKEKKGFAPSSPGKKVGACGREWQTKRGGGVCFLVKRGNEPRFGMGGASGKFRGLKGKVDGKKTGELREEVIKRRT